MSDDSESGLEKVSSLIDKIINNHHSIASLDLSGEENFESIDQSKTRKSIVHSLQNCVTESVLNAEVFGGLQSCFTKLDQPILPNKLSKIFKTDQELLIKRLELNLKALILSAQIAVTILSKSEGVAKTLARKLLELFASCSTTTNSSLKVVQSDNWVMSSLEVSTLQLPKNGNYSIQLLNKVFQELFQEGYSTAKAHYWVSYFLGEDKHLYLRHRQVPVFGFNSSRNKAFLAYLVFYLLDTTEATLMESPISCLLPLGIELINGINRAWSSVKLGGQSVVWRFRTVSFIQDGDSLSAAASSAIHSLYRNTLFDEKKAVLGRLSGSQMQYFDDVEGQKLFDYVIEQVGDEVQKLQKALDSGFREAALAEIIPNLDSNNGEDFNNKTYYRDAAKLDNLKQAGLKIKYITSLQSVINFTQKPPMRVAVPILPKLPENFLIRDEEFNQLKSLLLSKANKPIALIGTYEENSSQLVRDCEVGGIGKTTLALSIMYSQDWDLWRTFSDGIIWVTLGSEFDINKIASCQVFLLGKLTNLTSGNTDEKIQIQYEMEMLHKAQASNTDFYKASLKEYFANKRCLLILDDVWNQEHIKAFDVLGEGSQMLIITRVNKLVEETAIKFDLKDLKPKQALELLAKWTGQDISKLVKEEAIVKLLEKIQYNGEGIKLLALAARDSSQPNLFLWKDLLESLDKEGWTELNQGKKLEKLFNRSLNVLESDLANLYCQLAVFPPDTAIPIETVALLWNFPDNQSSIEEINEKINRLASNGLLKVNPDVKSPKVELHDLLHGFLQIKNGVDGFKQIHSKLVAAYKQKAINGWHTVADDGYFYENLVYHLNKAGQNEELRKLLLNYDWLEKKVSISNVYSLMADYSIASTNSQLSKDKDLEIVVGGILSLNPNELIGRKLNARYEVIKPLSKGGMGAVFLAKDIKVNKDVAIKVLTSRYGVISDYDVKCFKRECFNLAKLNHPNVVAITDYDKTNFDTNNYYFLVMDYIEGRSLKDFLKTSDSKLPLLLEQKSNIISQICKGLNAAHILSIIHSDIKPDNIMITSTFESEYLIKIVDFGISKNVLQNDENDVTFNLTNIDCTSPEQHGRQTDTVTRSDYALGVVAGTPPYMSPEQFNGRVSISTKSDIYSLGIVIYEILSNQHPLLDKSDVVSDINIWRSKHSSKLPTPIIDICPDLPENLANLVMQMLDKKPENRPSLSNIISKLQEILSKDSQKTKGKLFSFGAIKLTTKALKRAIVAFLIISSLIPLGFYISYRKQQEEIRLYKQQQEKREQEVLLEKYQQKAKNELLNNNFMNSAIYASHAYRIAENINSVNKYPSLLFIVAQSMRQSIDSFLFTVKHENEKMGKVVPYFMVRAVQFSPNNKCVISAGGNVAVVSSMDDGKPLYTLEHKDKEIIFATKFSPDNKFIVTGSSDHTAKIWDGSGTGTLLYTLKHQDNVLAVDFSPNSQYVVTAGTDKVAKVWDMNTGKLLHSLEHGSAVYTVEFSSNGQYIVTAGTGKTAKVWDMRRGKLLYTLSHKKDVIGASFSPDNKYVVTAGFDNVAKVWDMSDGKLLYKLSHKDYVKVAKFSPDSKLIVTTSFDKTAKLWDINGKLLQTLSHQDKVFAVDFSYNSQYLVTAGFDYTAKVWDTKGVLVAVLNHQGNINAVQFSPDGQFVITASSDNTAKVWKPKGIQVSFKHEDKVNTAEISSNNRFLITTSFDKTAKLWNMEGKLLQTLYHQGNVRAAEFSPNNQLIITINDSNYNRYDNTVNLWNIEGRFLCSFNQQGNIFAAKFSHNNKFIVTASADKTAKLWDIGGRLLQTLQHQDAVLKAEFSSDDRFIITAGADKTAKLWDINGNLLRTLTHVGRVLAAKFSSDDKFIVTASADNAATIWDINGKFFRTFKLDGSMVSMDISSDSRFIVTSTYDKTATIWGINGELVGMPNHYDRITTVKFSPNSQRIVTASLDGTVNVWDINANLLASFNHKRKVFGASFSPDSQCVVTVSEGYAATLWDTHLENRQSKEILDKISKVVTYTIKDENINFGETEKSDNTKASRGISALLNGDR